MFTVFPWHVLLISPVSHTAFLNGLQEKYFHSPQDDAKLAYILTACSCKLLKVQTCLPGNTEHNRCIILGT